MKLAIFFVIFVIIGFSMISVQEADAEKTLTVTQKCENTVLHLFVVNQDNNPVNRAKILDNVRMEVLATADESGFVVLPADLQGEHLRVGGGSYTPTPFTSEDCQPVEIEFEKSDQDIMIVHHNTWSDFDSTTDYGDGEYEYTGFTGGYIVGDILNLSEHNLTDIRITINPFGEHLGTAESKSWHPMKKILRPGEVSPFFAYMGGGFDNYSIKIDGYKGTSEIPIKPQVEISDILLNEDNEGNEILTIVCTNNMKKSDDLRLLLLGYSENNLLEYYSLMDEYALSRVDHNASDCITDGKLVLSESAYYGDIPNTVPIEYAKNDRLEAFLIQSGINLHYDVQEINKSKNLNAYENIPSHHIQTAVYSNYFPDSLAPKYVNIDNLKSHSEKLQEIKKSKTDAMNLPNNLDDSYQGIPEWVKNNAEWWANDEIDDSTFVSGIQYMIKEGIISVSLSSTQDENTITNEIPRWVKNNAEWWAQEIISDKDFLKGIEFLVENGIIAV